jgi:hypothetical protein
MPNLESHPFSAVRNYLFNIFAATLNTWKPFLHLQPEDESCCYNTGVEKTTKWEPLRTLLLTKNYPDDQIKKNIMAGACGACKREQWSIQGFGWETSRKMTTLKTTRRWKVILIWAFKKWDGEAWTGIMWLRIGIGGELCEFYNELSGSIKCG